MPEITLPPLSDERIDEIEHALFADISREQLTVSERRRTAAVRRGRVWMGGAAAAAVVAIAALIGPVVSGGAPATTAGDGAVSPAALAGDASAESAPEVLYDGAAAPRDAADREIITTASASVEVDDVAGAADAVADLAGAAGGYVESMSVGSDTGEAIVLERGAAMPASRDRAWITVRVPADALTSTISRLGEVGTVTAQSVDRRDVTTEAIDLKARVASLQASVQRLTELMTDASSTADLLAAEEALAQRQSELESYQQQLAQLSDQVSLSGLTVSLHQRTPVAETDPAGFGDGLLAGWNGLVGAVNATVIGLGFLLPWLAVAALAALVVWGVRRLIARGRARHTPASAD